MPKPLKPLQPGRSVNDWLGAELRHLRMNAGLDQPELARLANTSPSLISKLELGTRPLQEDIATKIDDALDTGGFFSRAIPLVVSEKDKHPAEPDNGANALAVLADQPNVQAMLGHADNPDAPEPPVNRREFLTGVGTWATILATETTRIPGVADLIAAVLDPTPSASEESAPFDELAAEVASAKRGYQSCHYREVLQRLPGLLQRLRLAEADDPDRAASLTADAYQVVSGVMLKHSELTLATLAADRSMTFANHIGDPVAVASSARAVTHVLLRTGYPDVAADFAASQAELLEPEPRTLTNASVQGALLLRGAVAAADAGKRGKAFELLDAADDVGAGLNDSDNLRGTGFSPVNIALHRVHIALVLGDAGRAVELAREINIEAINLVERKVSLAIDVASAFTQWGRYNKALDTLYYAEDAAPQEVRVRKNVQDLLKTMESAAPPSIRPHAAEFSKKLYAA